MNIPAMRTIIIGPAAGKPIVSPALREAFTARNAELDQLPHIDRAVFTRNTFLDTQPIGEVSDRSQ